MSEHDAWIALAKEFKTIDPDGVLGMRWEYYPNRKAYRFAFEMDSRSDFSRRPRPQSLMEAQFRAYSAKALEMLWQERSKSEYWFQEIQSMSANARPGIGVTIDPVTGETVTITRGLVDRVCQHAEDLCYRISLNPEDYSTRIGILNRIFQTDESARTDTGDRQVSIEPPAGICNRSAEVATFLTACNAISKIRIYKKHIWQSIGHKQPRQFEYWQACDEDNTNHSDSQSFTRILQMNPQEFLLLLARKSIINLLILLRYSYLLVLILA